MPVKLKGTSKRIPINFTVAKDFWIEFKNYCDRKAINKSLLIEQMMQIWYENERKKN